MQDTVKPAVSDGPAPLHRDSTPSPSGGSRSGRSRRRDRPRAGSLIPLNWWHDPKVAGLGSSGRDLLVMLLSWTADHLTDGTVPASTLRMLAAVTDEPVVAVEAVRRAGFIVVDADGNGQFPPSVYGIYNLVADEVAMLKAMRAAAGSRGGRRTAELLGRRHDGTFEARETS